MIITPNQSRPDVTLGNNKAASPKVHIS